MAGRSGLRPQDRADFEAVLHLALNTPDILGALRADPTGRAATRLRLRALADADEITAAAYGEYRTYLTCSTSNASAEETTLRPAGAGTAGLAAGPAGARHSAPPAPVDRRGSPLHPAPPTTPSPATDSKSGPPLTG
ncbi:hypothetical protein [Streptomyces sp. A30]|uniref:hypothetical protein n=1 Tax=Streptomyces sp. A30 TaxID=2789273 RepID=UPI00397FDA53